MARAKGVIPSPPDSTDKPASLLLASASTPPPSFSAQNLASIRDQGQTNTCVWFATAQAVRVFLKARGLSEDLWISTNFGYWNTLKTQGLGIVDTGCIPRMAMQVLSDAGFCDDATWAFDPANLLLQPPWTAYQAAFDQRVITGYYQIMSSGDQRILDVKTALANNYPVIYCSPVDQAYEDYKGNTPMPAPSGPSLGSHCRCLLAYDENSNFIEANSWGLSWGENGFGTLLPEVITWDQAHDFWVFSALPPAESP